MAFTATKNVPLAATTTGSWPRPAWYGQSLWGRPLDTAMLDPIYREQFSDALAVVVSDQERAGLDIVTCGDYFLDADLAGRSWHHYPLQRWRGVAYDELQPEGTRSDLLKYPPGTLLNEIYTSWRWPIVTGKIEHNPRNPLEYAKIYRMTQARTRKPVKFGTVSGQVMALFLDSHTPEYRIEDDKRQMIWDMATAINRELRELVASGCSVIQVEEPTIHFIACYHPEAKDTLNFLTEALNHELEGLDNAEVWIHTCWGNPMMQRVFDKTSYANALEIYLDRVKCDVLTLEMKDRGLADSTCSAPGRVRHARNLPSASSRTARSTPEHAPRLPTTSAKLCSTSTSKILLLPPIADLAARAPIAWWRFTKARRPLRARISCAASMACRKPTCRARIRSWSRMWCRLGSRTSATTAQTIWPQHVSTADRNRRHPALLRHCAKSPDLACHKTSAFRNFFANDAEQLYRHWRPAQRLPARVGTNF